MHDFWKKSKPRRNVQLNLYDYMYGHAHGTMVDLWGNTKLRAIIKHIQQEELVECLDQIQGSYSKIQNIQTSQLTGNSGTRENESS